MSSRYDHLIRDRIAETANKAQLNYSITISFVQTEQGCKPFCLTKWDVADGFRMVNAYAKAINDKVHGQRSDNRLPMILLPEYRTKAGDRTFLHYHGLIQFPMGRVRELSDFTASFWSKMGKKHFQSPIKAQVEPAVTLGGSMIYATKWLEDQFTLENSVIRVSQNLS